MNIQNASNYYGVPLLNLSILNPACQIVSGAPSSLRCETVFIKGGLPWALAWRLNVISQLSVRATTSGSKHGHPHLYKSQPEVLKG